MTTLQRQNLDSARRLAAAKFGITSADTAGLPYAQREAYNNELAAIILKYPERFDADTVARARNESVQVDEALEDASFDTGLFAAEAVKPLADAAVSVGKGALNLANMSKWLIPVVGIALVLIFLVRMGGAEAVKAAKEAAK